tara:strand:+ start:340 stop:762 length:423 start_codon:yes stop_codon:yes gene_type:complete
MKSKETKCAGGIIYNDKNEVVIVNQNHDSWSLPKGHIDPGESSLEAALREIYEETGIKKPTYIKSLGKFKRYRIGLDGNDDLSELKTIAIYLFKSNQINLQPIDPNNPEAIWVNVEEAYKLLSHKEDKSFFKKSLSLWLK